MEQLVWFVTIVLFANCVASILYIKSAAGICQHIQHRFFTNCYGYFISVGLAMFFLVFREGMELVVVVFLTNFFSMLAPVSILISFKYRFPEAAPINQFKWYGYCLLVGTIEVVLAYFAPEKIHLRGVVIYVNIAIVFIAILSTLAKLRVQFYNRSLRALFGGMLMIAALSFVVPLIYAGAIDPSLQTAIVIGLQLVGANLMLAGILSSLIKEEVS